MVVNVEFDREEDGRWIADVTAIPGVLAYGSSKADAFVKVRALALEVIADRFKHGEHPFTGHPLKRRVARLVPFTLQIRPGRQAVAR